MTRKPTQTTEIANFDEELARLAGAGAALTNSSEGGRFFSTRAGQLSYDDTPLPGNQMAVVVIGWCLENIFYRDKFDADNRTPPTCFAFGKDPEAKDEMAPHEIVDKEDVFERQSDTCEECPMNEWGSAEKGRGKACGNRRRLAMIPAGTYVSQGKGKGFELELFDDEDHFAGADVAYLKVPVMSGKGFDSYVKQCAEQLRRPLFAVFTRVWLEPDPKSQFKVMFELLEPVPNELIPALLKRNKDIMSKIDFPYTPLSEEDGDAKGGGAAQTASKKLAGRKPAAKPAARAKR